VFGVPNAKYLAFGTLDENALNVGLHCNTNNQGTNAIDLIAKSKPHAGLHKDNTY